MLRKKTTKEEEEKRESIRDSSYEKREGKKFRGKKEE